MNTDERAYPLPDAADDTRFTFGLLYDLAHVLHQRGFPPITTGADLIRLQGAVFRFLYSKDQA